MDKIHGFGCIITQTASILMRTYWPGPLTLLLPIAGKKAKLGFRLPDHPVALALIEAAGGAVLAPSANKSGAESPVTAQQACEQIGTEVDLILDGGQTGWGKDSTIVDLSGDEMVICRQGALSKAEILKSIQIRG
jgi:L-threonylcarbamoyladenylate synthase